MSDRPNILLLMTDQQKASALRMDNPLGIPAPSLERLAAQGIRYDQCYTPHPLCVPARVSFWTGRYPHEHGSRTNEILMPPTERTFADILREAGYALALFGKNHCFPAAEETRLFADRYVFSHQGPEPEACANEREAEVVRWIRTPGPRRDGTLIGPARINPFAHKDCPTAILARRTVQYLEARQERSEPFCAWVSFPDPHGPLQVPEPYASMHPPESIQLPPWRDADLDEKMERARVFRDLLGYGQHDEATIRQRVSVYYGMIRFVDDAVGQILDALERTGQARNTIVAFTSDHGDYAGEHRLTDKSSTFVDAMTRVPLIVSFPGRVAAGRAEQNPVSLLDVVPTALGLAGIARPAGIDGRMLPGTVDAAPGAASAPPRDAAFSEYGAGGPLLRLTDLPRVMTDAYRWREERPAVPLLRWREAEGRPKMIRMGRYKYVFDPMDPVDELYDLEADRWELTNLARDPAHADTRARLRDRLLAWSIGSEGGHTVPIYFDPSDGHNTTSSFVPRRD